LELEDFRVRMLPKKEKTMKPQIVMCASIVALLMLVGGCNGRDAEDTRVPAVRRPTFEPMNIGDYQAAYPEVTGLDCGMTTFFDTFINVYGVTVAAMPNTPVPDVIHAAKVYAQIMDSDEDFMPDDLKIYEYHFADPDGNKLIILVDTKDLDNLWNEYDQCVQYWTEQALRPNHSGVGHSRDGEKDTAVEELFHFYWNSLKAVYPEDFGEPEFEDGKGDTWSSTISNATDAARGFGREVTPIDCEEGEEDCEDGRKWVYPEGAWYTYGAPSCGYKCMVGEYAWWVWSTWIGYTEILTRGRGVPKEEGKPNGWCENISNEWNVCTREDLKRVDPIAYDLFNNRGYKLPKTIPYGEYGGNNVEYHGYEVEVRKDSGTAKYFVNRNQRPNYTFKRGNTYYFDQSLESNSGHKLRFSTTADGFHGGGVEYIEGVTTRGHAGSRGAYTKITVSEDAPDKLYYFCAEHPGMASDSVITVVD
jgi:hypothetical protein